MIKNNSLKRLKRQKIKSQILKEKIKKLMEQLQDFSPRKAITMEKLTILKEKLMI